MRKFIFIFLLVLLFSCGQSEKTKPEVQGKFHSFKQVPGITAEEISAIESLQSKSKYFVYGMPLSVEAFEDFDGNIRGFTALFCEWLTELFEIPFYPQLFDWLDLLHGLETGDIHFTGELTANEERQKIYHMTTDIASRALKYFRLINSRPMEDIMKERRIRCGFIEGTSTINTVTQELRNGTYEIVLLSDVSLVYDALKSGQIDAFYYSNTIEINFAAYHDIVSNDFFPLIYRPVSLTTELIELKPIITVMEKILENDGLRYLTELYNKGEREYQLHKLQAQLTEEEREYIKNNPVVNIAIDPGNYPDTFFDTRENEWRGIFIDKLTEVTALTGLTFELKNDENATWTEVYEMLRTGVVDIVPELIQSAEREGLFIWPEISQVADHYALISNSDFPDIKVNEVLYVKVGLAKNTAYTAIFRKWFPNHMNTIEYDGMNEAFDALLRGEIDMVMATQKRLLYLTHYLELPNYKTNVVFNYVVNSKFGFNKEKAILCSIVDKALGSIDITAISDKWMRQTYDYRLKLSEAQRPLYIGSSILLFAVLVLVVALFVRSRLEGRKLEQLVENRTHDLQMQTNTLNALIDSMPDLVFTMDTDLNFTKCNRKFLDHFGLTKSDVIGKGEECIKFPAKLENDHIMWNRRVLNERLTFVFEEQVPGADGTSPFFETIKSPIMLGNNKVGLLGIARDITKRKEMEETALAASQTKSAFLANMSHEIRTPMNSIMGFSELAIDMTDNPKIKDYLGKIRQNSEWLLQIINNILDISKIESGKMELEKIPFDMHDLFSSCRTLVLPKAVEKGLTLHFYAEPSLGKVPLGDPTRLRQVFVNFLSNAIKFTNTGIVKLFSKITNVTERNLTMYFEIKDSGIGMTPEQIDKIFDPFVQADSGTTRMFGGTGLGLSITKNIVELMGGEIHIESMPKVGTIFSFYLTFDTIDEAEANVQTKKSDHIDLEKPMFEGEILLCEDNTMNQEVISEHLARVGIKTIIAENGKIGVEMVQERMNSGAKQFNLIFMDVHMPVMDGLEASAKIIELNAGVPIIAMTANVMSTDMEVYLKSGMKDCIGKPFTSQELWHLLLKYFSPLDEGNAHDSAKIEADKDFLKNIQLIFLKDNKNKYEEICKMLDLGNIKEAHRLAHSLKSNAGQIGKTILQQAASAIESKLKDGVNNVTDDQLDILNAELNAVLIELQPLLEEHEAEKASAPKPATYADPQKSRELLDKLEPLLRSGNAESLKLRDELTSIPESEKLIELMEEYEFHKALAELVRIRGD